MSATTGGLREQKRRATMRAIQIAFLELSIERGFDGVTIEDVSRAAQISPRTFFNYFDSKEEAVAGSFQPFVVATADSEAFLASHGELLPELIALAGRVVGPLGEDEDWTIHGLRKELFAREPKLIGVRIASAHRFETQVAELVAERLRRAGFSEQRASDRARLATLVLVAITRSGWSRWIDAAGAGSLSDAVQGAYEDFVAMVPSGAGDSVPAAHAGSAAALRSSSRRSDALPASSIASS